jgi:exonuclease SbcD
MRILHTSDWHLGKVLMERSLLEDQRHALGQITDVLRAGEHDLVVVAGDIFDRSVPPEDAVSLLGGWLADVREVAPRLPIVIIAGNHDSGARLAWSSSLLSAAGVHIRGEADRLEEPVRVRTAAGEDAEVWPLPFLWPGAIAADEGPMGQARTLELALDRVRARQTAGMTQVLASHCFAQGGRTSDSERVLLGQATLVDPSWFEGFDYVALGHLHRPQSIASNARYSGSLLAYSFSEVSDGKGVVSVEVRAGQEPEARLVPIRPLRPMRAARGELDQLLHDAEYADLEESYLSIELTRPVEGAQPMAMLRQRFRHLLQLSNPIAEAKLASAPAGSRARDQEDVDADFEDFQRHIRGCAPPDDVARAFRALRGVA